MFQPQIIEVKPLSDYMLFLRYETGEQRIFDVTPYISGDWFGKLKDYKYFNTVRLNGDTVEWEGGQDIAPHELYEYASPQQKELY